MLSLRPANTQAPNVGKKTKKARNKVLSGGKSKDPQPKILNPNKPRPLQASTNTIHSSQKVQSNLESKSIDEKDLCKKPVLQEEPQKQSVKNIKSKSDENDVSAFIKNAYNPLDDIHPLDEELYKRVLKLELADDGLPDYKCSEPFDF